MGCSMTTTVREMTAADSDRVAVLAGELGYPTTHAEIEVRFREIEGRRDSQVLVAVDGEDRVVGWVHIHGHLAIVVDRTAEIGGLVVDSRSRGRGIGRFLMTAAEAWARGRGYRRLVLRSNTIRTEAHRFYQDLGYTIVKSQHAFQKSLLDP